MAWREPRCVIAAQIPCYRAAWCAVPCTKFSQASNITLQAQVSSQDLLSGYAPSGTCYGFDKILWTLNPARSLQPA